MKQKARHRFADSTVASAENRDSHGRPLPKLPAVRDTFDTPAPRLGWERMLARGRRHASAASISSLLKFRRLRLPVPVVTAARQPVLQFNGLGFAIRGAGLLAWLALGWAYGLAGTVGGAVLAIACFMIGRAKSKPWRCSNCKTPLATARVRVCPACHARFVSLDPEKVIPAAGAAPGSTSRGAGSGADQQPR